MTTPHRPALLPRIVARLKFLAVCALLFAGTAGLHAVDVEDCSETALREAIDATPFGDTVTFNEDCDIVLNEGPIHILTDVTIDANGFEVTISSGVSNRLFNVLEGPLVHLTLIGLTLTEGHSDTNGGALYIPADATVVLENCTFLENNAIGTNGVAGGNGANGSNGHNGGRGTPGVTAFGGAIYNLGDLTVSECRFFTNSAIGGNGGDGGNGGNGTLGGGDGGNGGDGGAAFGGAIYSLGTVLITNSFFAGNNATGGDGGAGGTNGIGIDATPGTGGSGGMAGGAGVYIAPDEFVVVAPTVYSSTFASNVVQAGSSGPGTGKFAGVARRGGQAIGGGICNVGELGITNCTFFTNVVIGGNGSSGGQGGSGGQAIGGGLYNTGNVHVAHCTFSSGAAIGGTNGAGGNVFGSGKPGKSLGGNFANVASKKALNNFFIANSINGTNFGGGGGHGKIIDLGDNVSMDGKTKFNKKVSLTKRDPMLFPLGDNGGPTPTMAIATNSPAVNLALDEEEISEVDIDQRGNDRTDGFPDAGAYEFESTAPEILSLASSPAFENGTLTVILTNNTTVTLTVNVLGDTPLNYEWFHLTNGGATNRVKITFNSLNSADSLTITNVSTNQLGYYFVEITNIIGKATSPLILLTNATPPVITNQPDSLTITNGAAVTFSVDATGDSPLAFQWRHEGTNISGATSNVFTIPSAGTNHLGSYTVVVTNKVGSVTSAAAILDMLPFIITQPLDQTNGVGGSVTFTVDAGGSPSLSFTWFFNDAVIPGATAKSFQRSSLSTNHAGEYFVRVANSLGTIDSRTAILTVTSAPPPAPSPAMTRSADVQPQGAVIVGPLLSVVRTDNGAFVFAYPSQNGATYEVQVRESLTSPGWTPLLTNLGTGDWVTNEIPASNSTRFFRVLVQ